MMKIIDDNSEEMRKTPVSTALTTLPEPSVDLEEVKNQYDRLAKFVGSMLVPGEDYGKIPGATKLSLWKGGAEKLLHYFGLTALPERTENCIENWETGFFHYEIRCPVVHIATGKTITVGWGSCNSQEDKYRWRWVRPSELPEGFDKKQLQSRKQKTPDGWVTVYRIPNPESHSLANTCLKMAIKRAVIDGALRACRASFMFVSEEESIGTKEEIEVTESPAEMKSKEKKEKKVSKPTPTKPVADTSQLASQPAKEYASSLIMKSNLSDEEKSRLLDTVDDPTVSVRRLNDVIMYILQKMKSEGGE